jgi:tRNA A-37 threonylcarbamoyl transferase component Bud32
MRGPRATLAGPEMSSAATDSSPSVDYYCPTCERGFADGGTCPTDGSRLIRLGGQLDPMLGRELDGKYAIVEKLGQGGMGTVYRAEQRGLGREVAIKVLSAQRMSDPEVIKRFLREAKLASRLGHPNAVGVIDFGQAEDGTCYLVMELVTGRTLEQVLADEGPLAPGRLVRIAAQLCDALECAHALQIVHRDLKLANAMLLAGGRDFVKILDFGLAKSVATADATALTTTGTVLGTPAYMSPELAHGRPCDGRADLYSLGVMLYVLGSGRLPFLASSPHEMIALHGSEPAPPMTGVPPGLARVVDRLLRKDPAERYPTAAAVRDALERALVERAAGAEDPGDSTPRLGRARRRWLVPILGGAVAAAGVAAYLASAGDPPATAGSAAAAADAPAPPDAPAPEPAPTPATEPAPSPPPSASSVPAPRPGRSKPARPTRPRAGATAPAAPPKPPKPPTRPPPAGPGSARGDDLPF